MSLLIHVLNVHIWKEYPRCENKAGSPHQHINFATQCYWIITTGYMSKYATKLIYVLLRASLAWNRFLHNAAGDEKKKMKKRRRNFHVSLQPAVISNISISSLWWHREDSTFSGVIDVTQQQQLRSFAVRAAGLAASVCGRAALLLEVKFLTSHQSKGGLAPQLAAGLPDKSTCGLACRCITVANGMVNLWPLTLVLIFPLLSYSQTWLQRESWRRRRERGWRR